jgi:cytochrome c-type biogenesis protein CcmH/NrfG
LIAAAAAAEAHNNLGVLQRDVGAIPDALASYERALQLAPESRNAGTCA